MYEPTVRGGSFSSLATFLTLIKVPTAGIRKNRYRQDGEKGVRTSGGREHTEVCDSIRVRVVRSDPDTTERDMFIYEYVGDVVSNPTFIKRMREYAEEGIKHFYFMMLQKDEVSETLLVLLVHGIQTEFFFSLSRHSSSTQRSAVVSAVSQITPVIRIASSRSGRLGSTFGWAFSQIVPSRRTRN
jgi:hypothetical protein